MKRFAGILLLAASLGFVGHAGPLVAADAPAPGWYFDGDLAGVWTGGNSISNSWGLGFKLQRLWVKSQLTFTGGGAKTRSSLISRSATGTSTDYEVQEDKTTQTTAELYFGRAGYEYNFTPNFFTFGGVDWLQNRFAGIDSRVLLALGAGNTWQNTEALRFKTYYSFTYTFQEDVVDNPFVKSEFPGLRLGLDLDTQVAANARLQSVLIADWNLDHTDDVRLDWLTALPVSISSQFELKPSLQLLWRNEPSLVNVTLEGSDDMVPVPLKKLDTIFSLALVVKLGPKAAE
jgi:putative salt-induced outer membrane protein YdiY